jgi:hypothetical protein
VVKVEKLYCSMDSAVSILASAGQSRVVLADVRSSDRGGMAVCMRVWKERRGEEGRGEIKVAFRSDGWVVGCVVR